MARPEKCPCGSDLYPIRQFDGYGIFLCYTCNACHAERMARYRPDIMSRYQCDEPIEED